MIRMEVFPLLLLFTILLLGILGLTEIIKPGFLTQVSEGFTNLPRPSYWASFSSPRSDIGPDAENSGYVRDPRYFNDYADVSRFGQKYDFCRVLMDEGVEESKFFACALSGSDFLDSTTFRTPSAKDGFRFSKDDYMNDINKDGRDDYCRILKWKDGSYQPVCARANDLGFDGREVIDPNPPEEINLLLRMYQECVIWLRFQNDMNDFVGNVKVQIAGKMRLDETARRETTEGLAFGGFDQFLRLSDSTDLSLGTEVPLRSVRAWMVWVYFEEFTNNAKIFDFGNGPGKDNVFLGIERKGDMVTEGGDYRPLLCGETSTVPGEGSGAQPVPEVPPETLMKTTEANVDEYTCTGFEIMPRRLGPSLVAEPPSPKVTGKATLIYEVWDKQGRKMRLKVPNAFPLKTWTHVCITATTDDALRPNIRVYVNGKQRIEKESGWLPATSSMSNCYLGKSNWMNSVSQYENRDELFRGRLFDFRAYRRSQSEGMVNESYDWGRGKLELDK